MQGPKNPVLKCVSINLYIFLAWFREQFYKNHDLNNDKSNKQPEDYTNTTENIIFREIHNYLYLPLIWNANATCALF